MVRWLGALVLFAVSAASAQTVMDGSDKKFPAGEVAKIFNSLRSRLFDPYGSQIENLVSVNPGLICGRVNAKNKLGAFVGFQKFGYEQTSGTIWIDPGDFIEGRPRQELEIMLKEVEGVIAACKPSSASR